MANKLIVLAPSCGGKSSLMRYLRRHTDLQITESDEAVTKANNGVWPDDRLKNEVLVPETTNEIINKDNVIYFASYIPTPLLLKAKERGFQIILLNISRGELQRRNSQRMLAEHYDDVSQWFNGQLNNFSDLAKQGVIAQTIDGNMPIEKLAEEIAAFANE